MPVVNKDLEKELTYVTNPAEESHIRALWNDADPLMQEISVNLIHGNNVDVYDLTKKA